MPLIIIGVIVLLVVAFFSNPVACAVGAIVLGLLWLAFKYLIIGLGYCWYKVTSKVEALNLEDQAQSFWTLRPTKNTVYSGIFWTLALVLFLTFAYFSQ